MWPENILGIDPDTTHVGMGVLRGPNPIEGRLVETDAKKAPVQARILGLANPVAQALLDINTDYPPKIVVIESQRVRTNSKVDPQDLVHLAQVTGICLGLCASIWPDALILMPEPEHWKKSVPKEIFTRRTIKKLGLSTGEVVKRRSQLYFCGKPISDFIAPSKHNHVVDALGLGYWAFKSGR